MPGCLNPLISASVFFRTSFPPGVVRLWLCPVSCFFYSPLWGESHRWLSKKAIAFWELSLCLPSPSLCVTLLLPPLLHGTDSGYTQSPIIPFVPSFVCISLYSLSHRRLSVSVKCPLHHFRHMHEHASMYISVPLHAGLLVTSPQ